RIDEFHDLRQGSMTVVEYESRFLDLLQYVDYMQDEQVRIHRFIRGLNVDLAGAVRIHCPQTLAEAVEKAYIAEETRGKTQQARDRVRSRIQQMQD
ncbi:hypothetical protein KI387_035729, partial [Taxus chinensis]